MTPADRKIIRDYATQNGAQTYRIRCSDQVDFYGRMPNSIEIGWYFVSYSYRDLLKDIAAEDELISEGLATRGSSR